MYKDDTNDSVLNEGKAINNVRYFGDDVVKVYKTGRSLGDIQKSRQDGIEAAEPVAAEADRKDTARKYIQQANSKRLNQVMKGQELSDNMQKRELKTRAEIEKYKKFKEKAEQKKAFLIAKANKKLNNYNNNIIRKKHGEILNSKAQKAIAKYDEDKRKLTKAATRYNLNHRDNLTSDDGTLNDDRRIQGSASARDPFKYESCAFTRSTDYQVLQERGGGGGGHKPPKPQPPTPQNPPNPNRNNVPAEYRSGGGVGMFHSDGWKNPNTGMVYKKVDAEITKDFNNTKLDENNKRYQRVGSAICANCGQISTKCHCGPAKKDFTKWVCRICGKDKDKCSCKQTGMNGTVWVKDK